MGMVGAVRFSTDSKKLTFKSDVGKCVEVWDIESQKLDVSEDVLDKQQQTILAVFSSPCTDTWPCNNSKLAEDLADRSTEQYSHIVASFCALAVCHSLQPPEARYGEVHENWVKAIMGMNLVWVNGKVLEGEAGIFGLLRYFARERALIRSLVGLGLSRSQAIDFVVHSGPFDPSPSKLKVKKGTMFGSAKRFAQEVLRTDTENNVEAEALIKTS
ncbi:hypothetical protein EDD22DRAFT_957142 [Suillus occidentalis]|nr:hypothetical protein EDD22DRAFT_957142 [Suillus occidentalis]